MDSILVSLANVGGIGLLAAALLLLHRDALASFRAELREERRQWTEALVMDRSDRNKLDAQNRSDFMARHQELMRRLDLLEWSLSGRRPEPHIEIRPPEEKPHPNR